MKTSYSKTWSNGMTNIPKKQNQTAKFTALAGLLIIGLLMAAGAASAEPAISKTALGKVMDKSYIATAVLNESITFTAVVTGDGNVANPPISNLIIYDVFPVTNGSISGWKYTGTKSCKYDSDYDAPGGEVDCLNNVKQGNETIFSSYNTTISVNWTIPSLAPKGNLTLTYTAMPTIYADKDTSWTTPVNCNNASLVGYSATDSACVLYILSRVELNKTITLQPNNLSLVTIWLKGVGGEGNTSPIAAENYSLQDIVKPGLNVVWELGVSISKYLFSNSTVPYIPILANDSSCTFHESGGSCYANMINFNATINFNASTIGNSSVLNVFFDKIFFDETAKITFYVNATPCGRVNLTQPIGFVGSPMPITANVTNCNAFLDMQNVNVTFNITNSSGQTIDCNNDSVYGLLWQVINISVTPLNWATVTVYCTPTTEGNLTITADILGTYKTIVNEKVTANYSHPATGGQFINEEFNTTQTAAETHGFVHGDTATVSSVFGMPDINITKKLVTPQIIGVGEAVIYNVTVRNVGFGSAYNITLIDDLNPYFIGCTVTSPGSGYTVTNLSNNTWVLSNSELKPNGILSFIISCTSGQPSGGSGSIPNNAKIMAAYGDGQPMDNFTASADKNVTLQARPRIKFLSLKGGYSNGSLQIFGSNSPNKNGLLAARVAFNTLNQADGIVTAVITRKSDEVNFTFNLVYKGLKGSDSLWEVPFDVVDNLGSSSDCGSVSNGYCYYTVSWNITEPYGLGVNYSEIMRFGVDRVAPILPATYPSGAKHIPINISDPSGVKSAQFCYQIDDGASKCENLPVGANGKVNVVVTAPDVANTSTVSFWISATDRIGNNGTQSLTGARFIFVSPPSITPPSVAPTPTISAPAPIGGRAQASAPSLPPVTVKPAAAPTPPVPPPVPMPVVPVPPPAPLPTLPTIPVLTIVAGNYSSC